LGGFRIKARALFAALIEINLPDIISVYKNVPAMLTRSHRQNRALDTRRLLSLFIMDGNGSLGGH
jgi:hypothetical protein